MIPRRLSANHPISRRRWHVISTLLVVATVITLIQFTPLALLATSHTSTLAGITTGMAVMTAIVAFLHWRAVRRGRA